MDKLEEIFWKTFMYLADFKLKKKREPNKIQQPILIQRILQNHGLEVKPKEKICSITFTIELDDIPRPVSEFLNIRMSPLYGIYDPVEYKLTPDNPINEFTDNITKKHVKN